MAAHIVDRARISPDELPASAVAITPEELAEHVRLGAFCRVSLESYVGKLAQETLRLLGVALPPPCRDDPNYPIHVGDEVILLRARLQTLEALRWIKQKKVE